MSDFRLGDIIISRWGNHYEVDEIGFASVVGKSADNPNKTKTFKMADLECIDHDDGLWQEVERKQ